MERTVIISNLKKIGKPEEQKFNLGRVNAIIGKNSSGKSSLINIIQTMMSVKGFMEEPVTQGQANGYCEYHGVDLNGNKIIIKWMVDKDNKNGKFNAAVIIDDKPKSISDPKKIMELIGNYYPLSVHDAFNMVKTSDGRKNFIENYIYKILDEKHRTRIEEIDLQITSKSNKQTENNLYQQRRTAKILQDDAAKKVSLLRLSNDDEETLKNTDDIKVKLDELKLERDDFNKIEMEISEIKNKKSHYVQNKSRLLENINELIAFSIFPETILEKFNERMDKIYDHLDKQIKEKQESVSQERFNNLSEEIALLSSKYNSVSNLLSKKQEFNKAQTSLNELIEQVNKLEKEITGLKEEKKTILKSTTLECDLEINDDTFSVNGFTFDQTSTGEAETQFVLLDLLSMISDNELLTVDDWSMYDSNTKKKIIDLATKRNKIVIGQQVEDVENVKVNVLIKD